MADLMPNDLSQLSDDEFSALCPHDGHAPGPEPLSPAAQAVLDAAEPCVAPNECPGLEAAIAAALRAAVDQAFPLTRTPWGSTLVPVFTAHESRDRLLAIADELKNGQ